MTDQNIVTDWPAYFAALGPGLPCVVPAVSPQFPGLPNPHIVMMRNRRTGDLETVRVEDHNILLDLAKEIYQDNIQKWPCMEIWVFSHIAGYPWLWSPTIHLPRSSE